MSQVQPHSSSSAALRRAFLDFFSQRGHTVVASSPLVPANDPTLLFTNAGMVQFKEVFLGREQRGYTRAATSQRCVRAGGKHNDLENVGYTARHHTFFEMLGNFSFGDYFKREAIHYAWEFLTDTLGLPAERLWVTVYEEDDEAAGIWLDEIGVAPERFGRIDAKDNFWSMGDTGPCGPCSEIFYDHGPDIPGGPPGSADADGDRYVEIWNLVFMQYDRDSQGNLAPLPKPSVDTGMGLERLAAVMQGVHSNYDIDLFRNLITAVAELTGTQDLESPSLKVIADHIRSCAFLITDGVLPANDGRGYVLRRIIRRAARHGHQLGLQEPFFYRLVPTLIAEMGDAYPELTQAQTQVSKVLELEETRFRETLEQGLKILHDDIQKLTDSVIPGEVVFKLYDTYGFPTDLTADIAREQGLTVDEVGFQRAMAAQRERARAASHFGADYQGQLEVASASEFTGYDGLQDRGEVVALFDGAGNPVETLSAGAAGVVVLDRTPFYAESGGQVGDTGTLQNDQANFLVEDTQKQGSAHTHIGKVSRGAIHPGQRLQARVDQARRAAIAHNHSATHLLHAALRQVLGNHVQQKGSLVDDERLRFDFSHFEPLTMTQVAELEQLVNEQIRANAPADTAVMSMDEAMNAGAMALFGEKYGEQVRVMTLGEFSKELCGGTHVQRAGDIGLFKIISEGGVAAGVRRIEAITGARALQWVGEQERQLQAIAEVVKGSGDVAARVTQLAERNRSLEKEIERLKQKLAAQAGTDLTAQAVDVAGVKVLAAHLEGADPKSLRDTADQLKHKLGTAVVVLAAVNGAKVSLVAGVTKDRCEQLPAGQLVNAVAQQVGGKGGGRPDMAQAGGNDPSQLEPALASVAEWVRERLG